MICHGKEKGMNRRTLLAVAISSALACTNALAGEDHKHMPEQAKDKAAAQAQEMSQEMKQAKNKAAAQAKEMSKEVKQSLQGWSDDQKQLTQEMINKYGEPSGVTPNLITWQNPDSPWHDITIYKEKVDHDFPVPHKDYLEQAVLYDVPADKMDDLAKFDGSVIVYKTQGRLAARCDKEAANFLALNLAHDIINDEKTVEEARRTYADAIKQMKQGNKVALMQGLNFDPMTADRASSPGETVVQR
jgi:gas vesicle protein